MQLMNLSQQQFDRLLAVILIVAIVVSSVLLTALKLPIPDFVSGIFGVMIGFISHALGVSSGQSLPPNGNGNGNGTTPTH